MLYTPSVCHHTVICHTFQVTHINPNSCCLQILVDFQILAASKSSLSPNPRQREILDTPKSLIPPNPYHLQILPTFKLLLPSNLRQFQILADSKASPPPNSRRLQILASFRFSSPSNPRCLVILTRSKSSPFPNPLHQQISGAFKSSTPQNPYCLDFLVDSKSLLPPIHVRLRILAASKFLIPGVKNQKWLYGSELVIHGGQTNQNKGTKQEDKRYPSGDPHYRVYLSVTAFLRTAWVLAPPNLCCFQILAITKSLIPPNP